MNTRVFLSLFLIFYSINLYSAPVDIKPSFNEIQVSSNLYLLKDLSGNLSFDEIKKNNYNWKLNSRNSVSLGYLSEPVWFRLDYKIDGNLTGNIYLELDYPSLDYIDMYIPLEDGGYRKIFTGDQRGFSSRDVKYMNPVFSLAGLKQSGSVYFRVATAGSFRFKADLHGESEMHNRFNYQMPIYWLFLGMLIVMLLYNSVHLLYTLERSYLFFGLFSISAIIHQMSLHGLGAQYIWGNYPLIVNRITPLVMSLAMFSLSVFIVGVLDLKKHYPGFTKFHLTSVALPQLIFVFSPWFFSIKYHMQLALTHMIIIAIPFNIAAIVIGLKKKDRYAWFLLSGFIFLSFSSIPIALASMGIIDVNLMSRWGIDIGLTLFIVLLSIGLQDRVISIKNKLQISESKVRNQYEELNATYEELQATNEELEAMNEELIVSHNQLIEKDLMIKALMDTDPNIVSISSHDGRFLMINESLSSLLGINCNEAVGIRRADLAERNLMHCEPLDLLSIKESEVRASGSRLTVEMPIVFKDGVKREFLVVMSAFEFENHKDAVLSVGVDITEKKNLERGLEQVQKMEAIGTLASGIAHDFNNVIQAISGNAELLKMDMTDQGCSKDIMEPLRYIKSACLTASELTSQLLLLGRKKEISRMPVDINKLVRDTCTLVKRVIPRGITVETNLDSESPVVIGENSRLEQVLLNLIINARDAMGENGHIDISTRFIDSGNNEYRVLLSVSDNGHGMSDETIKRIFEPFFTTKPEGKGTGLGLAMVYGIVQSHDGAINCISSVGSGTRFDILLPAQPASLYYYTEFSGDKDEPEIKIESSGNLIIFVDDDNIASRAMESILQKYGYRIHCFGSAEECIDHFNGNGEKGDLLITDLNLPGISGKELVMKMNEMRIDIPVIVATGQVSSMDQNDFMIQSASAFMYKPFIYGELVKLIKSLLEKQ